MKSQQATRAIPKIRLAGFSDSWLKVTIDDLADVKGGKRLPKGYSLQREINDYPYITVTDFDNGTVVLDNIQYVPESVAKTIERYVIYTSDIYISVAGYYLGLVGTIPQELDGANLTENADRLTNLNCDQGFLVCLLSSERFQRYISSVSTTSAQPKLSIRAIKKFPFFLPQNRDEQRKVAEVFGAVDAKLEALRRKRELLAEYKRGVMQKLFSQEIRFRRDDGRPYPDWEFFRASKLFKNHSNKNHKGNLPILAITQDQGAVLRDEIEIDIKSSPKSVLSYKIVDEGDFVISLRSFQGGIEYSTITGICSPAYTVLKPIKEIDDVFYKNYFKKDDFISRLSATVIGIREGKQISYSAFSTLKIPYPHPDEQRKIAKFLTAVDNKITAVDHQIEQMETFKKGLLQQMFV